MEEEKKQFENVEIKVIEIEKQSVIKASGCLGDCPAECDVDEF